jgi:hypothetical protein
MLQDVLITTASTRRIWGIFRLLKQHCRDGGAGIIRYLNHLASIPMDAAGLESNAFAYPWIHQATLSGRLSPAASCGAGVPESTGTAA